MSTGPGFTPEDVAALRLCADNAERWASSRMWDEGDHVAYERTREIAERSKGLHEPDHKTGAGHAIEARLYAITREVEKRYGCAGLSGQSRGEELYADFAVDVAIEALRTMHP